MNKYALLLKTGDSELRAMSHFDNTSSILPIIELTRGRKSKKDEVGKISKRIERIRDIFKDEEIILDLTSDESLSNTEIDAFFIPTNGYKGWCDYLLELENEKCFKRIIPSILVNGLDQNLNINLKIQANFFADNFKCIAYRCNIEDDGCLGDIETIKDYLNRCESYIIIDNGYIQPSEVSACAIKSIGLIKQILCFVPNAKIIITATSFPDKLPDEDDSTIPMSEINLYDEIQKALPNTDIIYGDYGGVNPIRNDSIVMAHGWRPRIDVPLSNKIYYYRRRRSGMEYSRTYSIVAQNVCSDLLFPIDMNDNWGIQQIKNAANGASPGSNPSFWISVRMNIHVEQQLRRLNLL